MAVGGCRGIRYCGYSCTDSQKSFLEMTPGPSAHLWLGKASHVVNPAINGVGKSNFFHFRFHLFKAPND